MKLLELFRPHRCIETIYDLDLDELRRMGVKGLILDLDNTLVAWGSNHTPEPLLGWVRAAKNLGFCLCFSSNARAGRVAELASRLGVPGIPNAGKPRRRSFRRAMSIMGTKPEETAVVGDQLLTDVLGGNRLGLLTVLVNPLASRELFFTRLMRRVERRLLKRLGISGHRGSD